MPIKDSLLKNCLELTKNILFKEIQQAHADAESAFLSYTMNLSALEAVKRSFRLYIRKVSSRINKPN